MPLIIDIQLSIVFMFAQLAGSVVPVKNRFINITSQKKAGFFVGLSSKLLILHMIFIYSGLANS